MKTCPEGENRKIYRVTDLFRQFSTPAELAHLQVILRRLPHPDAAELAAELSRPQEGRA